MREQIQQNVERNYRACLARCPASSIKQSLIPKAHDWMDTPSLCPGKTAFSLQALSPSIAVGIACRAQRWVRRFVGLVLSVALWFSLLSPCLGAVSFHPYRVKGIWTYESRNGLTASAQAFELCVDGQRYYMRVEFRRDMLHLFGVFSSDGIDSYHIWNPYSWVTASGTLEGHTNELAFGAVDSGVFPQGAYTEPAQTLWLAFIGPKQTNLTFRGKCSTPLQHLLLAASAPFQAIDVESTYQNSNPDLLDEIHWYEEPTGVSGTTRGLKYVLPGYPHGMLVAQLKILAYTNASGMTLPARFIYREFDGKPAGTVAEDRDDVIIFRERFFTTESVELIDAIPGPLPETAHNGRTVLAEDRVEQLTGRPFGVNIGIDPLVPRSSPQFKALVNRMIAEQRQERISKYLFIPVFLVLLAPLFLLFKKSKAQKAP